MTKPDEKAILIGRLRKSAEAFVNAASVSDELAAVCPDTNCWSILQITEHLGITERAMAGRFHTGEPNTAEINRAFDETITHIGSDRNSKRSAPERVHPTGKFASQKDALAEFRKARTETIAFVETYSADLRGTKVTHSIGVMDGHQLFLLVAAHAERHAKQAEEVKLSPAYQAAQQRRAS
jgi:DinB superfamily